MRRFHLLTVAALLAVGLGVPRATHAQNGRLCFTAPGIVDCIEGRFREFWEQNGGLEVFGYPLTPARMQTTAEGSFLVQVFERNRFEFHPTEARPYDVLLGRLSDDRLRQLGRTWQNDYPPENGRSQCLYSDRTRHDICDREFFLGSCPAGCATNFKLYWETHGLELDGRPGKTYAESLALFGLPLSHPTVERNAAGATVITQWFERARFEYHPDNPEAFRVLLGLLGRETLTGGAAQPLPPPPPPPTTCAGIDAPQDAILEPSCVKAGRAGRIVAYGFDSGQEVEYWITRAYSNVTVAPVQRERVNADGELVRIVDTRDSLAAELPVGDYLFIVQDVEHRYRPSLAPFRVIP